MQTGEKDTQFSEKDIFPGNKNSTWKKPTVFCLPSSKVLGVYKLWPSTKQILKLLKTSGAILGIVYNIT